MVSKRIDPYIDTDVIIRLLTSDDLKKQKAAARLFEKATKGEILLKAPATVIADAVYVLSSPRLYNISRVQIRGLLAALLRPSNVRIDDKQAILSALDLYATTNLDFGDAFLICLTKQSEEKKVYSYDHDFDWYKEIKRIEP